MVQIPSSGPVSNKPLSGLSQDEIERVGELRSLVAKFVQRREVRASQMEELRAGLDSFPAETPQHRFLSHLCDELDAEFEFNPDKTAFFFTNFNTALRRTLEDGNNEGAFYASILEFTPEAVIEGWNLLSALEPDQFAPRTLGEKVARAKKTQDVYRSASSLERTVNEKTSKTEAKPDAARAKPAKRSKTEGEEPHRLLNEPGTETSPSTEPEGPSAPSVYDTLAVQNAILEPKSKGSLDAAVRAAIDEVFSDVVGMEPLREALQSYGLTHGIVEQLEADGNALLEAGHLEAAEKIQELIEERQNAMPPHMVLTGPSGSGKSFAARKLGPVLKELGVLEKGHVVETGRDKLLSNVQGGTVKKVRKAFEDAKGGVLFIDEAYSLNTKSSKSGGLEFGQEALQTILRLMQEPEFSDVVVVMAGYSDLMENLLDSNPGLRSRVGIQVELQDYTRAQLGEIFRTRAESMGLLVDDEAVAAFEEAIAPGFDENGQPKYGDLGNGRIAVKVVEHMLALKAKEGARGVAALIVKPEQIELPQVLRRTLVSSVKDNHDAVIDTIERGLVGLHEVKERLRGLQQLGLRREALQLAIDELKLGEPKRDNYVLQLEHIDAKLMHHALFVGEAGTAKTTVARKLAEVLHSVGLLPQNKVVEAHARDLWTEEDIASLLTQARGAVLFIDELYALPKHLVATLTKAEELRGRTVLVGAGYPPEMEEFLAQNSGLESRFTQWKFANSTLDQCMAIFELHASMAGMTVSKGAKKVLRAQLSPHFDAGTGEPKSRSLGNGRLMRTILDRALSVFVPDADPSVIQASQISLPPKVAGDANGAAGSTGTANRSTVGFKTKAMRDAEKAAEANQRS